MTRVEGRQIGQNGANTGDALLWNGTGWAPGQVNSSAVARVDVGITQLNIDIPGGFRADIAQNFGDLTLDMTIFSADVRTDNGHGFTSTPQWNGVYLVTELQVTTATLVRLPPWNTALGLDGLALVSVTAGDQFIQGVWRHTTVRPVTLNSTALTFAMVGRSITGTSGNTFLIEGPTTNVVLTVLGAGGHLPGLYQVGAYAEMAVALASGSLTPTVSFTNDLGPQVGTFEPSPQPVTSAVPLNFATTTIRSDGTTNIDITFAFSGITDSGGVGCHAWAKLIE